MLGVVWRGVSETLACVDEESGDRQVVKENIEEFEMDVEEAIKDAVREKRKNDPLSGHPARNPLWPKKNLGDFALERKTFGRCNPRYT